MRLSRFHGVFAALLAVLLASCAGAPPIPANMPPPIPLAELRPTTDHWFSAVAEPVGTQTVEAGAVRAGEVLATIPFRYRHTAVLTEDVKGYSITVPGTRLRAGAPGYFAGNFGAFSSLRGRGPQRDMWCFFREAEGDKEPDPLCLLRAESSLAAIAPTRLSPYYWTRFSPVTGTFDYVHTPIFKRVETEMPVALALEYRFAGRDEDTAKVDLYIRGKKVDSRRARPAEDGSRSIPTIDGHLVLSRVEGDPSAVTADLR